MLGSQMPLRSFNEALTWENMVYTLCIDKEWKLSTRHTATTDKKAEHLSQVYQTVI
jgi:hypothetical protein